MHGRDVRDLVDELAEVAAEVRVPGVAVGEVGVLRAGGHREVDRHRARAPPCTARSRPARPRARRRRPSGASAGPGRAPAVDGHVDEPVELPREVLDVHARAAVDVRRVLAGQERDADAQRRTRSPLPTTTIPPARRRTAAGRARGRRRASRPARSPRSCRRSRSGRPRSRRRRPRPSGPSPRPWRRSGRRPRATAPTAGRSRRRRSRRRRPSSRPPCPVRPGSSNTNFAGGSRSGCLRIGQLAVVEVEDRVGRDQVHVGVVVGVERSRCRASSRARAPRRPGRGEFAKSNTCASPRSTIIVMMSRADVVASRRRPSSRP